MIKQFLVFFMLFFVWIITTFADFNVWNSWTRFNTSCLYPNSCSWLQILDEATNIWKYFYFDWDYKFRLLWYLNSQFYWFNYSSWSSFTIWNVNQSNSPYVVNTQLVNWIDTFEVKALSSDNVKWSRQLFINSIMVLWTPISWVETWFFDFIIYKNNIYALKYKNDSTVYFNKYFLDWTLIYSQVIYRPVFNWSFYYNFNLNRWSFMDDTFYYNTWLTTYKTLNLNDWVSSNYITTSFNMLTYDLFINDWTDVYFLDYSLWYIKKVSDWTNLKNIDWTDFRIASWYDNLTLWLNYISPFRFNDWTFYYTKQRYTSSSSRSILEYRSNFYTPDDLSWTEHPWYQKVCALKDREVLDANLEKTKISVLYPDLIELINYDEDPNTIHYWIWDDVYLILYNPDLENYSITLTNNWEIYYLTLTSKSFFESRNNYFIFNVDVSKMNWYKFYSNLNEIWNWRYSDVLTTWMLEDINLNRDLNKRLTWFKIIKTSTWLTQNLILPSIKDDKFIFQNNLLKKDDYIRVELLLFKKLYDEVEVCWYYPIWQSFDNMSNKEKLDYIEKTPSDFDKEETVLDQVYKNPLIVNPNWDWLQWGWEDENWQKVIDTWNCEIDSSNVFADYVIQKTVTKMCIFMTEKLPSTFINIFDFTFSESSSFYLPFFIKENDVWQNDWILRTWTKKFVIWNDYLSFSWYTREIVYNSSTWIKKIQSYKDWELIAEHEIWKSYFVIKWFILLLFLLFYLFWIFTIYTIILFPLIWIVLLIQKFWKFLFPWFTYKSDSSLNVLSLAVFFTYYVFMITFIITPLMLSYLNVADVWFEAKNFLWNFLNNIFLIMFNVESGYSLRSVVDTYNVLFQTWIFMWILSFIINRWWRLN